MSDDTEILNRHPLLKAVVDYCLKRIIAPLIIAGAIGGCNFLKTKHDEKWIGDNLGDKTKLIQQLETK